ncbi:hydrolase [Dehalogenimonas alkenigignens]|nr:hydrolase [Dehalogenimonas alkenigignens]
MSGIMDEGECLINIPSDRGYLSGDLCLPAKPDGMVIFAHGSGSSRKSSRNRWVAAALRSVGFGTLLFDLLTPGEEAVDRVTAEFRFNIELLTRRLLSATDWVRTHPDYCKLPIGFYGASTGAAAALCAASQRSDTVRAVVSRGGRPDLALRCLPAVRCPTMLIVGSKDTDVIPLNNLALERLNTAKELVIVAGASHLFEEPGKLDEVRSLAASWFLKYLTAASNRC